MKTEFQLKIIFKIKELRENQDVSQALISDILGLNSYGSIGNIESSKFPHKYTLEQIRILCNYFNYPFPALFLSSEELELPKEPYTNLLIDRIINYAK